MEDKHLMTLVQLKHFMGLFKLNNTSLAQALGISRSIVKTWFNRGVELNQMNQMALCYLFETMVVEGVRRDNESAS